MQKEHSRKFSRDVHGNVAPFFGLMVLPMLAITGAAIDFGQNASASSKLQNALDSATIAVCGGGTSTQTSEEIIRAYLGSELTGSGLTLAPPADPTATTQATRPRNTITLANATIGPDGSVTPRLTVKLPTKILSLIGINETDVTVESNVACGAKRLELSLVLDVTGSMDDSVNGKKKIDSMKEASLDVVNIFKRNMESGATRIALVPFAASVNAGSYADAVRGTIQSGTSTSVGMQTLKFRDRNYNWAYYSKTNCVSERRGSNAYTDAAPSCSGNSCSAPVGHVYTSNGSCSPSNEIVPLSNNETALKAAINSYQPSGATAGHIGAAWGWYMLSNKWASIFPAASQPEVSNPDELIKATIIMTDGEFNIEYRNGVDDNKTYFSANNGSSSSQFAKICEGMKDPNGDGVYDEDDSVVVYAIGFGISSTSTTAQRLKACATDDTKWFFPYNGEELRAAFTSIGKQLSGGQVGKAVVRY